MKSLFRKRSLEQRASEKRRVEQTLPRSPHAPEASAPEAAEPSPSQMTARSKADALKALVLTIPEDDPGLARMLVELGELQREAKQHDEAHASLEQALLAAREARDQSMVLIGLNSLGLLLRELGQERDFDTLRWHESVCRFYAPAQAGAAQPAAAVRSRSGAAAAQEDAAASADMRQTKAATMLGEAKLLHYTLTGARTFFPVQ
jgi:tetratricopeptide (TPR) repeat protein